MRLSSATTASIALLDAALQVHRVHAAGQVAHAFVDHRVRQHGGGGGAVAGHLAGARGDLAQQLRAHVLEAVLELDRLGHQHARVDDLRRAEVALEDHGAPARAQRDLDRIGQHVDAAPDACRALRRGRAVAWAPSGRPPLEMSCRRCSDAATRPRLSLRNGPRLALPRSGWLGRGLPAPGRRLAVDSAQRQRPPAVAQSPVGCVVTAVLSGRDECMKVDFIWQRPHRGQTGRRCRGSGDG